MISKWQRAEAIRTVSSRQVPRLVAPAHRHHLLVGHTDRPRCVHKLLGVCRLRRPPFHGQSHSHGWERGATQCTPLRPPSLLHIRSGAVAWCHRYRTRSAWRPVQSEHPWRDSQWHPRLGGALVPVRAVLGPLHPQQSRLTRAACLQPGLSSRASIDAAWPTGGPGGGDVAFHFEQGFSQQIMVSRPAPCAIGASIQVQRLDPAGPRDRVTMALTISS